MRIPNAWDSGLGQEKPEALNYQSGSGIAQGLGNLAGAIEGIAQSERQKTAISNQTQTEKLLTQHQSNLEDVRKTVLMDDTIPPDQHYSKFEEAANALKQQTMASLSPEQQQVFDTAHEKLLLSAKESFSNMEISQHETAQKLLERSTQEKAIIDYKDNLNQATTNIISDPDIPDDKKYSEISRVADIFKNDLVKVYGPGNEHLADPFHEEAVAEAQSVLRQSETKKALDASQANLSSMVDSLIQRAAAGPQARQEAEIMFGMIDKSMISAKDQENLKQYFYKTTQVNEILSAITAVDRNKPANALKEISSIKSALTMKDKSGDYSKWQSIDPAKRDGFIEALNTDAAQMRSRIQTERNEANHIRNENAKNTYESWKDLAEQGSFNANQTSQVYSLVKGTPWEDNFRTLLEKTSSVSWRNEQVAKHGIKFLANYYGIPMAGLNIMQPLGPQIEYRKAAVNEVFQKSGMKLSPLTPDEADSYSSLLGKQNASLSMAMITDLTKNVGKENASLIAQQLANKDPQTAFAIGMNADGKAKTAEMILQGSRYLKEGSVKLPQTKGGGTSLLQDKFNRLMGDAMRELPMTQQLHYEAFESYYAALAGRKGEVAAADIDTKRAEKAFSEIVGNVISINGKKLILPESYSEDKFLDSIKKIDGSFISRLPGGGIQGISNDDAAKILRKDATWQVTTRPGVYRVEVMGKNLQTKAGNTLEVMFP